MRSRRGTGGRAQASLAAGLLLLAIRAPLAAVEPLVLRVADAIGAPGHATAIVLRTYATRPVRRGRAAVGGGGAIAEAPLAGGSPIAQVLGCEVYGAAGDLISCDYLFDSLTQTIDADFDSALATINSEDGVFGVIYVELAADLTPGQTFPLALNAADTYLLDPEEDVIVLGHQAGELTVRAVNDALEFEVDGGKVHPGSGATIELGTGEPFGLRSGHLVVQYEAAIASGLPTVTTDARHGVANLSIFHPAPGILVVDFTSPADDFNTVPGDLIRVQLPTIPGAPLGSTSPLTLDAVESFLEGAGGVPLEVDWIAGAIEFSFDSGVFADDFETGDPWVWSRIVTP